MEHSMKNGYIHSKHETLTFAGDQNSEESSWTIYFEDFFEASSSKVDVGDCSSSFVSDAASFVATKKTFHVSKQEGSNKIDMKKTRNREIPFGRHHDLEDTASSPSRSPNVCTMMMSLLENNTSHGDCIVCDEERGTAMRNQGGLSVDLTKKRLCLVPLSMVTNFLR